MPGYRWKPLEDLTADWKPLASVELASLAQVWQEQAQKLKRSEALREFNERLAREWAIETGIIEKLYSIDRGTTQLLIEKGIQASLIAHGSTDKPAEQLVPILEAQTAALEGVFDFVKQNRELSAFYIKELHQIMTKHQETIEARNGNGHAVTLELQRGVWKIWPNNPTVHEGEVHEYCPPLQVQPEIERLLGFHNEHAAKGVPPEVEAAWLHHRFTQIHPFQDGNGRIARALASLVFLRASWFPLVVRRDVRDEYIGALESADHSDLAPLVRLFTRIQKAAFINALSLSESVMKVHEPIEQIIAAAGEKLRAKTRALHEKQQSVFKVSQRLQETANQSLLAVKEKLDQAFGDTSARFRSSVDESSSDNDSWFKKQIVEAAIKLGYYADTRSYRAWIRLRMTEARQAEIVISFHALGTTFTGVAAVCAFLEFRDKAEGRQTTVEGPYVLCKEVFQFSYLEEESSVRERFVAWLQEVLSAGLDQWRRQL
ncbi:MAG: Fic family protein [Planctomycetota bacterium]